MKFDLYYDSRGAGRIHGCRWMPNCEPKGIVQIIHGIAEHVECYEALVKHLNACGYIVVAEDHMGHGRSISEDCPQGYFAGDWFAAVADSYQLLRYTMKKFPGLPYVIFGHSMGSFLARTLLCQYPNSGISAAIICGTAWQNATALKAAKLICDTVCRFSDEKQPSDMLQKLMFGSYNKRIPDAKTANDWLSRDESFVQQYNEDPLCGFPATPALIREMMKGIAYNQNKDNIAAMSKELPILLIAGQEDPVGDFGDGVELCAKAFRDAGMEQVNLKLYADMRHVIHQEIGRNEVLIDITNWIESVV